jgi:hypothetical protein
VRAAHPLTSPQRLWAASAEWVNTGWESSRAPITRSGSIASVRLSVTQYCVSESSDCRRFMW